MIIRKADSECLEGEGPRWMEREREQLHAPRGSDRKLCPEAALPEGGEDM